MNTEKFYTLKNSHTKDNCTQCKEMANRIYPKNRIPDLPLHPNCACTITEIPTLVMPKYIINLAKEKTEYLEMAVRFPADREKKWYKSSLSDRSQDEYIVFSNDGIVFYTSDGGATFKKLLITSDEYAKLMDLPKATNDASENQNTQVTSPDIVEKIVNDLISNYIIPKVVKELLYKQVDDYKTAYKIYNDSVSSSSSKDQAKADMKDILNNLKPVHRNAADAGDRKIVEKSEQEEKKWWHVLKNKDGTYSLYDNQRNDTIKKRFHEQIFVFEVSEPSVSKEISKPSESGNIIGFGSRSMTLITGGWEFENIDLSLLDFLTAQVAAEINSKKGFEFGAMVSIWTPSVTFSIGSYDIKLEANIGSFGRVVKILDPSDPLKNAKFGKADVFGLTISFIYKDEKQ